MSRKRNGSQKIIINVNILSNNRVSLEPGSLDSSTVSIIVFGATLLAVLLNNQEIGFSFLMEFLHGLLGL